MAPSERCGNGGAGKGGGGGNGALSSPLDSIKMMSYSIFSSLLIVLSSLRQLPYELLADCSYRG